MNQNRNTMYESIYHPNMKVRYAHPECGYPHDQEQCNRLLDPDKVYTVSTVEEESWRTKYFLRELPNETFNSVMFEEVKE